MDQDQYESLSAGSTDNVENVTESTFKKSVLQATGPIAVEFMSYACSHCGTLEPVLQQVAVMLKSKVKIFRVNTATEQDLSANYKVEATPTLIMFLHGRAVGRIEGPNPSVSSLITAMAQPFRGQA